MQHEMMYWNGEPAIRVRLDYGEAREYLALDEDAIAHLDSLTASERDEVTLELYLVPLRKVAEYAVGTAGKPTEHLPALSAATTTWAEDEYDEALYTLEGIDRAAYLEILDRAALLDYRQELRDAIPEPDRYEIEGYEVVEKVAKPSGTTARVWVPKSWEGKRVKIVRIDP